MNSACATTCRFAGEVFAIASVSHWVFEKTGLRAGDLLKGVVGYWLLRYLTCRSSRQ
jgi:hypothetical protein